MPFSNDLLEQARHLATRDKTRPKQASLRRAVSTAYYALFHLLISEAVLNWRQSGQRPKLARLFEHSKMRSASEKQRTALNLYFKTNPAPSHALDCARHLYRVADTFSESQQERHTADYDTTAVWARTEMLDVVTLAFESWQAIRSEPVAQAYLMSMLGRPQGA